MVPSYEVGSLLGKNNVIYGVATTSSAMTSFTNEQEIDESSTDDVMTDHRWLRVVFVTLYCVIFVLGLTGNVLVIFIVARNKVSFHSLTI